MIKVIGENGESAVSEIRPKLRSLPVSDGTGVIEFTEEEKKIGKELKLAWNEHSNIYDLEQNIENDLGWLYDYGQTRARKKD